MAFVKNRVVPKDCGKTKHPSEADALHWLAKSRRFAVDMSAYYHGPCQAWHVGHTPMRRGRR